MNKLMVVGLGPGHSDYILPIARKIIDQSDIIIGGKRHIESVGVIDKEVFYLEGHLAEIPEYVKANIKDKEIAVVVSGDTGFYSLLRYLRRNIKDVCIEAVPGISSMQYLFSKLGLAWDDAYLGSLHGRTVDLGILCREFSKVGLLTDQKNPPSEIAKKLISEGIDDKYMVIGENLSYPDELIRKLSIEEVVNTNSDDLNVVVIMDKGELY